MHCNEIVSLVSTKYSVSQEGWPSSVGSCVHAHGPCSSHGEYHVGGGDFHGMHCAPHSGSLGVLG